MKGKKKILKARRKNLLTLCLALAMAFCYNMPVFAQEYQLNKKNENNVLVADKNLKNTIVWAGEDSFTAQRYKQDDSLKVGIIYHIGEDNDKIITSTGANVVPVFNKGTNNLTNFSGEISELYDLQDTVRAWKISEIEQEAGSGWIECTVYIEPVNTYKITYHIGDTEYAGGYYAEKQGKTLVTKDELVPYGIKVPEGAKFLEWYDNPEFEGDPVTVISAQDTEAKEFYAKLEYEEYKIEYELGDGGFLLGYEPPVSYTAQDEVTLPTAENLSKPMARFNGWYDNADFTGEAVTSIPAGSTGDKIFYANFDTVIYEVEAPDSYILNSGEDRTFHVLEASMDDLVSVEWDGAELNSENYTVSAGSTKVTFSPDFLDEQEVGEHLFKAIFKDGYGESQIKVLEPEEESVDPIDEPEDSSDDPEEPSEEASEEVTEETSEEVSSEGDSTEKTAPDAEVSGGDDKSVSEDKTEASNVDSSVKTGDNAEPLLAAILMIAGLAGAVFVAFLGRRKRSSGK